MLSRHIIDRWSIASAVPLDTSISYTELAWKTLLPVKTLRRVLRHAITQRIFYEPSPGYMVGWSGVVDGQLPATVMHMLALARFGMRSGADWVITHSPAEQT